MAEKRAKDQRFKSAAVYVRIQLAPPLVWQVLLANLQPPPLLAPVALHPCAKISPAAQRRPAILALASAAAWHVGRDERPNVDPCPKLLRQIQPQNFLGQHIAFVVRPGGSRFPVVIF